MQKYREPLTNSEKDLLNELSGLDFTNHSEQDVREEYIAPLVKLLGYFKESDYSVSREESYKQNPLFLRISSSKRIKLDYICNVRKNKFWLLEAKSGKNRTIEEEELEQAYFYSIHKDINCRYFVLCNGWLINLYDRDSENITKPILSIEHKDIVKRFLELDRYIGATQILSHLKNKLLFEIENVLSAELYPDRLKEFTNSVTRLEKKCTIVVWDNLRRVNKKIKEEESQSFIQHLKKMGPKNLLSTSFNYSQNNYFLDRAFTVIMEDLNSLGAKHWSAKGYSKTTDFFHFLFITEPRPVRTSYYINTLVFLLKLQHSGIETIPFSFKGAGPTPLKTIMDEWIYTLLSNFKERKELRLMWAIEPLAYRMGKHFILQTQETL